MTASRRWTDDEKQIVAVMFRLGVPLKEISKSVDRSCGAIMKALVGMHILKGLHENGQLKGYLSKDKKTFISTFYISQLDKE